MLRATRVLLQSAAHPVKRTTGIVGLDVVPNARAVLTKLYEKTLQDLKILPEGIAYRVDVEKFTKHRLSVVQKHDDLYEIEKEIGCGQVEELIEDAKGELELIPQYASWKPWEDADAVPEEDEYADFFEELKAVDPQGYARIGGDKLGAAARREAEAEARFIAASEAAARAAVEAAQKAAAEAAAKAAAAAAAAAAPAAGAASAAAGAAAAAAGAAPKPPQAK